MTHTLEKALQLTSAVELFNTISSSQPVQQVGPPLGIVDSNNLIGWTPAIREEI